MADPVAKLSHKMNNPQDQLISNPVGMMNTKNFRIVGIGASAGGLEAFQALIKEIPKRTGMAFVLIQHLDPQHKSLLTEILQRESVIPVLEVHDQMTVQPDHIYVIPPNRNMTISSGILQLSLPNNSHGQRMPIDGFLSSLANDQLNDAVGIILSGTGTDGSLGLKAIDEAGGITIVQEPTNAKYNGMPNSAVASSAHVQILLPEEMIHVLMQQTSTIHIANTQLQAVNSHPLEGILHILQLLKNATGHDFSQYKKSTIRRRIERCMAIQNVLDTDQYALFLKKHPKEIKKLLNELLINVTCFFRDTDAFEMMASEILPMLLDKKKQEDVIRVWVAGCSSGEEAYSIAILLREHMDLQHKEYKVSIFATDLDEESIAEARAGTYSGNITENISASRLKRYFTKDGENYRVKRSIRDMVVFAVQNIIKDPPLIKLDLLCCRNLMIYLEPELQNRLIPIFHYALNPGGVLFLSPAESIGNHTERFNIINRKFKIYQALATTPMLKNSTTTDSAWTEKNSTSLPLQVPNKHSESNIEDIINRELLIRYSPASVLTDLKGLVLFVHGDMGKYLLPALDYTGLNIITTAREDLTATFRAAIPLVASQDAPRFSQEICIKTNVDNETIRLVIDRVSGTLAEEKLLLISFIDNKTSQIPEQKEKSSIVDQHSFLNSEFSTKALRSTNKELQSTNEELQSTNEELETSKEELQSVNEELVTVNTEFQQKIEQLAGMQNDMKNLLDNMNIGTIFLDKDMVIRRFTREATRAYRLIASDVGRALEDIKCEFKESTDLLAHAQEVLKTLNPFEIELSVQNGNWYLAHIQPYRTLDNVVAGVVMTFTDITARVKAEAAVQTARILAEGIVDTVLDPLVVLDASLNVVSASRSFYQYFKVEPENTIGRLIYDLGNQQWNIPALRELLETILPKQQSFEGYLVEHEFPFIGLKKMTLNARRIVDSGGNTQLILFAMRPLN